LHGVNLNLLGERSPTHYGVLTLSQLESMLAEEVTRAGWEAVFHQTNHEGEYVELLHRYRRLGRAFIVNPGAWTHYSYAIRDALEQVVGPVAEVHLSAVDQREEWRRRSVIRDVVDLVVSGKGPEGYRQAFQQLRAIAGGPSGPDAPEGRSAQ